MQTIERIAKGRIRKADVLKCVNLAKGSRVRFGVSLAIEKAIHGLFVQRLEDPDCQRVISEAWLKRLDRDLLPEEVDALIERVLEVDGKLHKGQAERLLAVLAAGSGINLNELATLSNGIPPQAITPRATKTLADIVNRSVEQFLDRITEKPELTAKDVWAAVEYTLVAQDALCLWGVIDETAMPANWSSRIQQSWEERGDSGLLSEQYRRFFDDFPQAQKIEDPPVARVPRGVALRFAGGQIVHPCFFIDTELDGSGRAPVALLTARYLERFFSRMDDVGMSPGKWLRQPLEVMPAASPLASAFRDGNRLEFGTSDNAWYLASDGPIVVHEAAHVLFESLCPEVQKTPEAEAINEGFCDTIAALVFDAPEIGLPFGALNGNPDQPLRSTDNHATIWSQGQEPHERGSVFSGLLWDLRKVLASEGIEDRCATDSLLQVSLLTAAGLARPDPTTEDFMRSIQWAIGAVFQGETKSVLLEELEQSATERGIWSCSSLELGPNDTVEAINRACDTHFEVVRSSVLPRRHRLLTLSDGDKSLQAVVDREGKIQQLTPNPELLEMLKAKQASLSERVAQATADRITLLPTDRLMQRVSGSTVTDPKLKAQLLKTKILDLAESLGGLEQLKSLPVNDERDERRATLHRLTQRKPADFVVKEKDGRFTVSEPETKLPQRIVRKIDEKRGVAALRKVPFESATTEMKRSFVQLLANHLPVDVLAILGRSDFGFRLLTDPELLPKPSDRSKKKLGAFLANGFRGSRDTGGYYLPAVGEIAVATNPDGSIDDRIRTYALHETMHAFDAAMGEGGLFLSDSPEWLALYQKKAFPTACSSKNPQEFFAECATIFFAPHIWRRGSTDKVTTRADLDPDVKAFLTELFTKVVPKANRRKRKASSQLPLRAAQQQVEKAKVRAEELAAQPDEVSKVKGLESLSLYRLALTQQLAAHLAGKKDAEVLETITRARNVPEKAPSLAALLDRLETIASAEELK